MRRIVILGLVTALATVLLVPSVAQATKPLDVDCELLWAVNDAIDDFLDSEGIKFKSLGETASITDPAEWAFANGGFEFFSGGEISFETASQFVSTDAKCGLIKPIIDNIRD